MGCPSSETTLYATVYCCGGIVGLTATRTVSPSTFDTWAAQLVPLLSVSPTVANAVPICWLNVNSIIVRGESTLAPAAGIELSSWL
ncbi:Uncharacterised protein [Nocardia asteroides]|nr:hypothetical protein SAMN05444423_104112 [Nocardia asteroides]VEG33880.1 Uncharacterised protein [Nocardia asteroides]